MEKMFVLNLHKNAKNSFNICQKIAKDTLDELCTVMVSYYLESGHFR